MRAVLPTLFVAILMCPGIAQNWRCDGGGVATISSTFTPVGGVAVLSFSGNPGSVFHLQGGVPGYFPAPPLGDVCLDLTVGLTPIPLPITIPGGGTLNFPFIVPAPAGSLFYMQALVVDSSIPGGFTISSPLSIEFTLSDSYTPTQSGASDFRALAASASFGGGRYVFISGGGDGLLNPQGSTLSSAEVYDHYTRTFTALPLMTAFRMMHQITLLQNGRLLITGGVNNTPFNGDDAEVFDPAIGSYAPAPNLMSDRRAGHSATALDDGRVLVCGGNTDWAATSICFPNPIFPLLPPICFPDPILLYTTATSTTDIYDPTTNLFTPGPALANNRVGHGAVKLPNGKVLIVGGVETGTAGICAVLLPGFGSPLLLPLGVPTYSLTAELFDPVTNTFTPTGSLAAGRGRIISAMTLLPSGKVIMAGGVTGSCLDASDMVDIWDPVTGTWTIDAAAPIPLALGAVGTLSDGSMVISGGATGAQAAPVPVSSVYRFQEGAGWSTLASLPTAVTSHVMQRLADGSFLLSGGEVTTPVGGVNTNASSIWTPPF